MARARASHSAGPRSAASGSLTTTAKLTGVPSLPVATPDSDETPRIEPLLPCSRPWTGVPSNRRVRVPDSPASDIPCTRSDDGPTRW